MPEENHQSESESLRPDSTPSKRLRTLRRLRFLPIALIFASVSVYVWLHSEAQPQDMPVFIKAVHLTRPPALTIDASTIVGGGSEKDFYILIKTLSGEDVRLPTFANTLIGNGLTWDIKPPLPLSTITEIDLYDDDMLKDDFLDRVSVNNELVTAGQKYQFEVVVENPVKETTNPRIIWSIISGCGVLALVTGVFFIRDQAVN